MRMRSPLTSSAFGVALGEADSAVFGSWSAWLGGGDGVALAATEPPTGAERGGRADARRSPTALAMKMRATTAASCDPTLRTHEHSALRSTRGIPNCHCGTYS